MLTTGAQEANNSLVRCTNTNEEDVRRVVATKETLAQEAVLIRM